jgi:hypothetical protein
MDDGLRLEKSTGYSPSTRTGSESASAPVEFTENKKGSPVSTSAHSREESLTSTGAVSVSKLLAIQVMMGDFKALKNELPASRQSNGNGKIYWSAELPGHTLAIESGKLLVDGKPVEMYLEKLLAEEK